MNAYRVMCKELDQALNHGLAYLLFLFFVIAPAVPLFWADSHSNLFLNGVVGMEVFFQTLPWLLLVFVPALAMRAWAEERRAGTLELLLSFPLDEAHLVLGKFAANLLLLLGCLAITLPLAWLVGQMGDLDWGPVWGGYLGAIFLGAACLSICLFLGAIPTSQVSAFVLGLGLLSVAMTVAPSYVNLAARFANIARGVIDSRDLVFYLLVTIFFLHLNIRQLKAVR